LPQNEDIIDRIYSFAKDSHNGESIEICPNQSNSIVVQKYE